MKINTNNLLDVSVTEVERENYKILEEKITTIEKKPEFLNTIGASLMTSDSGTFLHITTFSSIQLSKFITELLSTLDHRKTTIRVANKNIQNLWTPTWTTTIKLDNG